MYISYYSYYMLKPFQHGVMMHDYLLITNNKKSVTYTINSMIEAGIQITAKCQMIMASTNK